MSNAESQMQKYATFGILHSAFCIQAAFFSSLL